MRNSAPTFAVLLMAGACATAGDEPGGGGGVGLVDAAPSGADAWPSPGRDAASVPDATSTPDASPPPPDTSPLAYEGAFWALETVGSTGVRSGIGGRVIPGPFWGPKGGELGDCALYVDVPLSGGSAGTVAVIGTSPPVTIAPIGVSPMASYSAGSLPTSVFEPGDEIQFEATGGPEVGAFSGSVVAPQKLTSVNVPGTASRTSGIRIDWDAGDGDFMLVWLSSGPAPGLLSCTVPDTGSFTIPGEAVDLIPPGNASAIPQLYRMNQTTVAAGASTVHLWASDSVEQPETPIVP